MISSVFERVKISSIVSVVPGKELLFDDRLNDLYAGNQKKMNRIKKTIGVNKRRVVEQGVTAKDLCLHAARKLFEINEVKNREIGIVVNVSQCPDFFLPSNSCVLHGELDLDKECACFDINLGCSGYVYGLWVASSLLETSSAKKALLIVGEALSPMVDENDAETAILFGDAGTATLLEKSQSVKRSYYVLNTDGKCFDKIIVSGGSFRNPEDDRKLKMNGADIFAFTIKEVPASIRAVMKLSGKQESEIDSFVLHQANEFIVNNIAGNLKFDKDKFPTNVFSKYGNQSSASIPCVINEEFSSDKTNLKVIMSGFGVGLSWASCYIPLEETVCPKILIY